AGHPLVQTLRALRPLADQAADQLGGPSLFNPAPDAARNQEALTLLNALRDGLRDFSRDQLSLEDTFRLEFRVQENQNDTGWVEGLTQAGSQGTDVLVKAMIYLTLLDVVRPSTRNRADWQVHACIDETGILDAPHIAELIRLANSFGILLVSSAPHITHPAAYQYIYQLDRPSADKIQIFRLMQPAEKTSE
ncbi:MAG: hypothetical protein D6722_13360, partial [Bacteroidetes bacterium]